MRASLVPAALLAGLASSCNLFKDVVGAPAKLSHSVLDEHDQAGPTVAPSVVAMEVMRFADSYGAQISQATGEFARKAGTPEAHIQALGWSVWQRSEAFMIASGENPNRNLLDMLVFVTLSRTVHEDYWTAKVWHEADEPMVTALRHAEEDIWIIADRVLSKKQHDSVKATLVKWREQNPDAVLTGSVRMPAFQDLLTVHEKDQTNALDDFAGLFNFDPLSGLEPATREVKQARLLAERALYYVQRTQLVIPTQLELLSLKMTSGPDVQAALQSTERVSKAADSLAETAKTLPESVRVEREAAVKQISDELTAQRQGLVVDLEHAQEPAKQILTQAQVTLEAAERTSTALQGAIGTLDTFVGRFDKKQSSDVGVVEASGPTKPAGKPFDVAEYGVAAEHIGDAARDLNGLIDAVDRQLPQLRRTLDEVAARGDQTVDHAFERGLTLGLLLIGAAALAALAVRWISNRWLRAAAR
jgi:hypothetical protein